MRLKLSFNIGLPRLYDYLWRIQNNNIKQTIKVLVYCKKYNNIKNQP